MISNKRRHIVSLEQKVDLLLDELAAWDELRNRMDALCENIGRLTSQQVRPPIEPKAIYTYADVERLTGFKVATINMEVGAGRLKRMPGKARITGESVLEWLNTKTGDGRSRKGKKRRKITESNEATEATHA